MGSGSFGLKLCVIFLFDFWAPENFSYANFKNRQETSSGIGQ
jgi:hypothetical protein